MGYAGGRPSLAWLLGQPEIDGAPQQAASGTKQAPASIHCSRDGEEVGRRGAGVPNLGDHSARSEQQAEREQTQGIQVHVFGDQLFRCSLDGMSRKVGGDLANVSLTGHV
ncbi:hypothetical protein Lesp01_72460 [Lentzea sp. NBRC 102530]|nr:hypothetical protein Lesp01_72460 [Lentzea sp. NBRC 102530]